MIISQTPFRVSLAGGGTDLREFYEHEVGAVLSTTIDKYMYIAVNRRFDDTIRLSYSKTEIVERASQIQHPIVREALALVGIETGIEITSVADVPAGTGVGSSSSFTVGLLNALYAFRGVHVSAERLARDACLLEIERLGEPIGRQDQYAAAHGGLLFLQFQADDSVRVDPVVCRAETRRELEARLQVFYVGGPRKAASVLTAQKRETRSKLEWLTTMRDLAGQMRDVLVSGQRLHRVGEMLHESWMVKRRLAEGISTPEIDAAYDRARQAGALGGKLLGAGGGGFLLLFVEAQNRERVRAALAPLRELPISLEPQGSRIVFVGGM